MIHDDMPHHTEEPALSYVFTVRMFLRRMSCWAFVCHASRSWHAEGGLRFNTTDTIELKGQQYVGQPQKAKNQEQRCLWPCCGYRSRLFTAVRNQSHHRTVAAGRGARLVAAILTVAKVVVHHLPRNCRRGTSTREPSGSSCGREPGRILPPNSDRWRNEVIRSGVLSDQRHGSCPCRLLR